MKKLITKKTLLWCFTIVAVGIVFTFCKKEKPFNESNSEGHGNSSVLPDYANARLLSSFSGITYNTQFGMLEFTSHDVFFCHY